MGAISLFSGYHPLISGVFPYLPTVRLHLHPWLQLCFAASSVPTRRRHLLPAVLQPQVWSFSGFITCSYWLPGSVLAREQSNLDAGEIFGGEANVTCSWCAGNDSALQWRFSYECGGVAVNWVRSDLRGPGALLPADPRVQLRGASGLCCVFIFNIFLGGF